MGRDKENRKLYDKWYNSKRSRQSIISSGLKYRYGITYTEKLAMFERQEGACGWCKKKWSSPDLRDVCVDHSYQSDKVRGRLCRSCNAKLGHMERYMFNVNGTKKWVNKYVLEGLDVDGR